MLVQVPGWEFCQDTEVSTPNLVTSAMGSLVTTASQALGLMSHPNDGALGQDRVSVSVWAFLAIT